MKQRFKLPVAVYLLVINKGKVLLMRRANTGYEDGNYSLPAGHIDGNEPMTSALMREAMEEVGLALDPNSLTLVHTMHRSPASDIANGIEMVDLFFTAEKFSGSPVIKEPHKCDHIEWFARDNLPENTIPYIRMAITNYYKQIPYSEFGW